MIIKELKAGDRFIQDQQGEAISFEILAIERIGRQFDVRFKSQQGVSFARYAANAFLPGQRVLHA